MLHRRLLVGTLLVELILAHVGLAVGALERLVTQITMAVAELLFVRQEDFGEGNLDELTSAIVLFGHVDLVLWHEIALHELAEMILILGQVEHSARVGGDLFQDVKGG